MLQFMTRRNSIDRRFLRSWPRWFQTALQALMCLTCSHQLVAAETLRDLNPAELELITHLCAATQFQSGTEAYRVCVQEQLVRTQSSQDAAYKALAALSMDEQFAAQSACKSSDQNESDEHRRCISEQLAALENHQSPSLSQLTTDEQYIVSQQCFEAQTSAGASSYRACVNNAIDSLADWPAAEFADKTSVERNNIQVECSLYSANVTDYRQCLLTALGIAFNDNSTRTPGNDTAVVADDTSTSTSDLSTLSETSIPEPDALATASDVAPTATPDQAAASAPIDQVASNELPQTREPTNSLSNNRALDNVISGAADSMTADDNSVSIMTSRDSSSQTDTPIQTETATTSIPDNTSDTPFTPTSLQQRLESVKARFETLSSTQKVALFTSLAIAPLIMGLYLAGKPARHASTSRMGKRVKRSAYRSREDIHAPSTPNLSPMDSDSGIQRRKTSPVDLDAITVDLDALNETAKNVSSSPRSISQPEIQPGPNSQALPLVEIDSRDHHRRFRLWLNDFPVHTQLEFAIELLIYWMAYADNRFDPESKRRILQMKDPDNRSLIKRWAFIKDAHALSDAIGFVQENTSAEQREQIIDLLMALLVNENALTPIQNNLLRFLCDAFGLGSDGLNRQYKRAYGSDIPPIPRPDKIVWWDKISGEQKLRWNARAIAIQPDIIRHRIALGQPLQGDLNKASVVASFNLAARRCHHARVGKLGAREQELMKTHMKKFETARDALLELVT